MSDERSRKVLKPKEFLRVAPILWAAMAAAVVLYVAITLFLSGRFRLEASASAFRVLLIVLSLMSLAVLLVRLRIRTLLADDRLFQRIPQADKEAFPESPPEAFEERSLSLLLQLRIAIQVTIWALDESLGIFGFILSLAGRDARYILVLGALAILLLLLDFPRRREAEEQVDRWKRRLSTRSLS